MDKTVHEILQARTLEWVAVPFSRDLPNRGIEPRFPELQADSLLAEPQGKPIHGKPLVTYFSSKKQSWELWEDNFDLIKNGNHPITK